MKLHKTISLMNFVFKVAWMIFPKCFPAIYRKKRTQKIPQNMMKSCGSGLESCNKQLKEIWKNRDWAPWRASWMMTVFPSRTLSTCSLGLCPLVLTSVFRKALRPSWLEPGARHSCGLVVVSRFMSFFFRFRL